MILGAFTSFDKSSLVIISKNKTTMKDFVKLFYEEVLCPFYYLHDLSQEFTLMEDGALVHRNKLPIQ